jgi:hypothetical protein
MTNPYQAPAAPMAPELSVTAIGEGYTSQMLRDLKGTRPWVRFFAVLLFFSSAILLGTGLFMPLLGRGSVLGFVFVGLAVFNVLPALFLQRYANAITRLATSGASVAFEEALVAQRGIWRSLGISIIMVAALAGAIVVISRTLAL